MRVGHVGASNDDDNDNDNDNENAHDDDDLAQDKGGASKGGFLNTSLCSYTDMCVMNLMVCVYR